MAGAMGLDLGSGLDNSVDAAGGLLDAFVKGVKEDPYANLPGHLKYLKDQIAQNSTSNDAVATAFDAPNLGLTTEQLSERHRQELLNTTTQAIGGLVSTLPEDQALALTTGLADHSSELDQYGNPNADQGAQTQGAGGGTDSTLEGNVGDSDLAPWGSDTGYSQDYAMTGSLEAEQSDQAAAWMSRPQWSGAINDGVNSAVGMASDGGPVGPWGKALADLISSPTMWNADKFYATLPDSQFTKVRDAAIFLAEHPPAQAQKIALQSPNPYYVFGAALLSAMFPQKAGAYMAIPYQYGLRKQQIEQTWENQQANMRFQMWKTGQASLAQLAATAQREDAVQAQYLQHKGDQAVGMAKNTLDAVAGMARTESANAQKDKTAALSNYTRMRQKFDGTGDLAQRQAQYPALAQMENEIYGQVITPFPTQQNSNELGRVARADEATAAAGEKRARTAKTIVETQWLPILNSLKVRMGNATIENLHSLEDYRNKSLDLREVYQFALFDRWKDDRELRANWQGAQIDLNTFKAVDGMAKTLQSSITHLQASQKNLVNPATIADPRGKNADKYKAAMAQWKPIQDKIDAAQGTLDTLTGKLRVAAEKLGQPKPNYDTGSGGTYYAGPGITAGGSISVRQGAINKVAAIVGSTQYKWGGTDLKTGVDCSGLVYAAFNEAAKEAGKPPVFKDRPTASSLWQSSQHIRESEAGPGDLVFFRSNGKVSHVAIYLGNGLVLESPRTGKPVSLTELSKKSKPIGFGRVKGID